LLALQRVRVWLEDVLVVRQIIEKFEALRITEFKV
jgi:hypothetical protein